MIGTERGTLLDQMRTHLMFDKYDEEIVRREIAAGWIRVDGEIVTEPGLIIHAGQHVIVPFLDFMYRCSVNIGSHGKNWIA